MQKIPAGAWLVVADGAGARLSRNFGKGVTVPLKQQKLLGPEELIDDGTSGKRLPESTAKANEEASFAKQLARRRNTSKRQSSTRLPRTCSSPV